MVRPPASYLGRVAATAVLPREPGRCSGHRGRLPRSDAPRAIHHLGPVLELIVAAGLGLIAVGPFYLLLMQRFVGRDTSNARPLHKRVETPTGVASGSLAVVLTAVVPTPSRWVCAALVGAIGAVALWRKIYDTRLQHHPWRAGTRCAAVGTRWKEDSTILTGGNRLPRQTCLISPASLLVCHRSRGSGRREFRSA